MYDILSLTNSTLLTADMILYVQKTLYPIHGSHCPFHRKMCIPLLVRCHCPPTKSNLYLNSSLETVIREPTLYKLLMFHVPNLVSIFLHICYILYNTFSHLMSRPCVTIQIYMFLQVFREPKRSGVVEHVLNKYAACIGETGSKGAIMFSVVGESQPSL
jgi:hypothetical protein